MVSLADNSTGVRRTKRWVDGRRGSVLILVMTILGVLFVTGVAFMATMNFDAEMIGAEKQMSRSGPSIASVIDDTLPLFQDTFIPTPGSLPTGQLIGSTPYSFAELPGVHNLFAPIEPYERTNKDYYYRWFTDIVALRQTPFVGTAYKAQADEPFVATANETPVWRVGVPDPLTDLVPIDADGDGIVDGLQVELMSDGPVGANQVLVEGAQLDELRRALNPPSSPRGPVFLGLRVIAHGGMVDLGHSHESLIRGVLGVNPAYESELDDLDLQGGLPQLVKGFDGYDPAVEEPSLRRRSLVPPRVIPTSDVQGNLLDEDDVARGGGDFAKMLFPEGEDLENHSYWPYSPDERDEAGLNVPWALRMNSYAGREYDLRHLVTTISHDDLLMRDTYVESVVPDGAGGFEVKYTNVLQLMEDANVRAFDIYDPNWRDYDPPYTCDDWLAVGALPFEYVRYPHDLDDSPDWCERLAADPNLGNLNPLKGKLRLSLPWLDDAVDPVDGVITPLQRVRIIQDAFTMLLLNARGTDWGAYQTYPGTNLVTWVPNYNAISRTAASLTANLIDFMDADDDPTRVELRQADPTNSSMFGRSFPAPSYVYGLERQPFVTEVIAQSSADIDPDLPGDVEDGIPYGAYTFGVELLNPSNEDILLGGRFSLVTDFGVYPLPGTLPSKAFVGFYGSNSTTVIIDTNNSAKSLNLIDVGLMFDNASTISLVREHTYSGDLVPTRVVVDEFDLSDSSNIYPTDSTAVGTWDDTLVFRSCERVVDNWRAPIPIDFSDPFAYPATGEASFGLQFGNRTSSTASIPGVEVQFADVGVLKDAFPTSGSMLLLMRHANGNLDTGGVPFTTYLNDEVDANKDLALDNGRMPVFDDNGYFRHHVDPAQDPRGGSIVSWPQNEPGEVIHLPWGQMVFDYFTALPLASEGPFADDGDPNIPRVDLDGLRVHGRININAAPASVLAGLPLLQMDRMPAPFRGTLENVLDPDNPNDQYNDDEYIPLGPDLADAIVAYREAREIAASGNYDDPPVTIPGQDTPGRGWQKTKPTARRGMGFMSVGELANIHHNYAAENYRIDRGIVGDGQGELQKNEGDYIKAIAPLVALGDWVTVRSQVFTIYGVLRGDVDPDVPDIDPPPTPDEKAAFQAADVDSRAIRFQETVDRLPTFLGEKAPNRIGKRTVAKYSDFHND
ncbi:MAG: hypothetical protein JSU63_19435 [Phycisphaerales bacterium]|nr:MAG: hypothetical protein JSU63_19435 [Phycisphaerales bacterium]